jgi:hypothetical protein
MAVAVTCIILVVVTRGQYHMPHHLYMLMIYISGGWRLIELFVTTPRRLDHVTSTV